MKKLINKKMLAVNGPNFPVVGIGASAGGLEAVKLLLDHLPHNTGMAFILVQHLDPTHVSMIGDLLSPHTNMQVLKATDGLSIEPDHLYIIPPGMFLSVSGNVLRLNGYGETQRLRAPFNFLLESLARELGPRAVAVVLSGMGTDGSDGLKEVHAKGGLVLAQDPSEAAFDGMPQSAIATGKVHQVASISGLAVALIKHSTEVFPPKGLYSLRPEDISKIIELILNRTGHDFRQYKRGTLERRIEKRLALSAQSKGDIGDYLTYLEKDPAELARLAQDLLINVTDFFRDTEVFDLLEAEIIPALIQERVPDTDLRIWVVGCSTGEEAYSLGILFDEALTKSKSHLQIKIFATDIDSEAISIARNGYYVETARIAPLRLKEYFTREGEGFRVRAKLRNMIVFSVHDVLTDPPFANLHLISCRNLLIYLGAEAQKKLADIFHFSLNKDGLLLLGQSETLSPQEERFISVSQSARLYRNLERRSRSRLYSVSAIEEKPSDQLPRFIRTTPLLRTSPLVEIVQREVLKESAPATILINDKRQCLYSLGPTDRYFKIPSGALVNDILSMARSGVSSLLNVALKRAMHEKTRVVVSGANLAGSPADTKLTVAVKPLKHQEEILFLISLCEEVGTKTPEVLRVEPKQINLQTLEEELSITRSELSEALQALELSNEAQRTISEEALSTHEEYQAANEELIASKEELQSLNEELIALNNELQETLDRRKIISDDLQNVLYSTNVPTLFLDRDLNIRLFTPSIQLLFSIRPNDIGRPLADLNPMFLDSTLFSDARDVLRNNASVEHEVEAQPDQWYLRRILPYKTHDGRVDGVVISFIDITESRKIREALIAAENQARTANLAKTRFLSMASHDLRQPLQTLTVVQEMLAKSASTPEAIKLLKIFFDTLEAMTQILNTLLDINQIEAGVILPHKKSFSINDIIKRLGDEFVLTAQAKNIVIKAVSCSLRVYSDPALLEVILRNILSNAINYTNKGKILIGCRRRGKSILIQVFDTGIGIPEKDLPLIFDEYYKADALNHKSKKGLGLGLAVVRRIGTLLNHEINVRTTLGRGSVFSFSVPLATDKQTLEEPPIVVSKTRFSSEPMPLPLSQSRILVIEDEQAIRELLDLAIKVEGYRATTVQDGTTALDLVSKGGKSNLPHLIVSDYTLPEGRNGVEVIEKIWEIAGKKIPAIVLTGDITSEVIKKIEENSLSYLAKPVRISLLISVIKGLL